MQGIKFSRAEKVRQDFPIFQRLFHGKQLAYLDSAATSQKPFQVIQAISEFYSAHNSNIHRGIYKLSEEATVSYENSHLKVSGFIHSRPEEIIFTKNTTESLNLLAYSLTKKLKKGDEIVLSQMEHHSNLVPWQQLALEKGLALKYLPLSSSGHLEDFSAITNRTRIVSVAHSSNVLGTINPIREISKIAHDHGAVSVIDAAQSVPHMPVDVRRLECDFLAFSGHKMLGPMGIGVLWGRKSLLEGMDPFLFGGGMIQEVTYQSTSFNELPWKFEAGTPPAGEAAGLSAAIDYLQKTGMDNVFSHEKDLVEYAYSALSEEGCQILGPNPDIGGGNSSTSDKHIRSEARAGLVSFNAPGIHPHDLATLLDQDAVAIRAGHHCAMPLHNLLNVQGSARASFYIYNTREEIDRLVSGIQKAKKVFK